MQFEQFYLECLAHASYLVGDGGECAIIDPQRDVDGYIEEAEAHGLEIRHIIETHLHADFVSGHVELAQRTGATIHVGRRAVVDYPHQPMADGDELRLGNVRLRFLETPGHTPESICILVFDHAQDESPSRILTGDTLFLGDVGRPDLVGSKGFTSEDMAGMMYDSLREKILPLSDEVEVFPGHGAGSACGKNISSALSCTMGRQRDTNYALQDMSREAFISLLTTELSPAPAYFAHSSEMNRHGARPLADLPAPAPLSPEELSACAEDGAVVLDVRPAADFGAGHVPGSVNIGLGGQFASWVGNLIPTDARLALVAKDGAEVDEAVMRLARVGFDDVIGQLVGGFPAWPASGRDAVTLPQLTIEQLAARLSKRLPVLDVRRIGEFEGGHVPGARHIPLEQLEDRLGELDPGAELAVICQTGYRSSAAASLLERAGFEALHNVVGGTAGWIEAGQPTEAEVSVP
jgi:hydroxyacylglutathione hydrolase